MSRRLIDSPVGQGGLLPQRLVQRRVGEDRLDQAGVAKVDARHVGVGEIGLQQIHQRQAGAGNCGGACPAIGLQNVAIDPDRARPQLFKIHDRAQRTAD